MKDNEGGYSTREKEQRNGFTVPTRLLDLAGIDEMADHPDRIAFWVSAMIYSARNMTEGVIKGAAKMTTLSWARRGIMCPPKKGEKSGLWKWDGDDLILNFYDHGGHAQYLGKLRGAAIRGEQRSAEAEMKHAALAKKRVKRKTTPPNDGVALSKRDAEKDTATHSPNGATIRKSSAQSTHSEAISHGAV